MQQSVIDRLRMMAEAEQGLVTLDENDIGDFGFHNPVGAVFDTYYGAKEGHLPNEGGLLDQPKKLWTDVQQLAYLAEIMRHIVREENKSGQGGGDTGNKPWGTTNMQDGVFSGKMFDGT